MYFNEFRVDAVTAHFATTALLLSPYKCSLYIEYQRYRSIVYHREAVIIHINGASIKYATPNAVMYVALNRSMSIMRYRVSAGAIW